MSEEKKILEVSDSAETPIPPKRRGRKKKTDIEASATLQSNDNKKSETVTSGKSANLDKPVSEAIDTVCESNESIELDNNGNSIVNAEASVENAVTADDATENEAAAVQDEDDAAADCDANNSENADSVEDTDAAEESAYANIEHFSDTYEIKYLSDEVDLENVIENNNEAPVKDEEYENLTIFEDSEPKIKREPKQKRVREVSPDYKEYDEKKPRHVDARFDLIELFVYTLVVIMLITTFFVKHSEVSGWSMQGTLSDKDHVLISDFLYKPKQYDIIVLHDPEANEDPVVKRIIALGGQTVRLERRLVRGKSDEMISYYETYVFVDDVKVPDKYRTYTGSDNIVPSINEGHKLTDYKIDTENPNRFEYAVFEYVVPEGEVYVMGDHRNDSKDSRNFGSVNENKILGRVLIRFFPFDSFGTVD